jgi:succinate dehydrogenase/fumarate reductase flavoprotein subunit
MNKIQNSSRSPSSGARAVLETDVVVVGGGGSGLAAAIEASSIGRDVILIEKNAALGGSTARSVGSVTATNTPHQLKKGIRDCPDDHFEDMGKFCARVGLQDNTVLRRILIDNVSDTFRWLMSMGVVFHGPLTEPPHRKPRMHNVLPNSRAYIYHLSRRARRLGVQVRLETRLTDLLIEDGRALGIVCDTPTGPLEIRARGGVVLTTGDFGGNPEMRKTFLPARAAPALPINPTNTGDGHQLVVKAGGQMMNAQHFIGGVRFPPPRTKWIQRIPPWGIVTRFMSWSLDNMPSWLLRPFIMSFLTTVLQSSPNLYKQGAVLINKSGERFNDELTDPIQNLAEQPDSVAYILLDGKLAKKFSGPPFQISTAPGIAFAYLPDYRRTRKDIYKEAKSVEELAAKIGIDPARLARTVSDYNSNRDSNSASASKRGERPALDQGPFVALGPVHHYITFSDSGVAVTDRHEVIGAGGKPIQGLFAAGFIGMGGMLLEGLGHHLGWAFTSGRRAGRHAAFRVVTPDLPPVQ